MSETWVSTKAGRHLSRRRKNDTGPEVALRRALHAKGLRFRLQRRLAPRCTPDLVLPRYRIAVFVDGCFWHSCPEHGRKTPFTGPNAQLWEAKMARNRARDRLADQVAAEHGYVVVRIWECQIVADVEVAVQSVVAATTGQEARPPFSRRDR